MQRSMYSAIWAASCRTNVKWLPVLKDKKSKYMVFYRPLTLALICEGIPHCSVRWEEGHIWYHFATSVPKMSNKNGLLYLDARNNVTYYDYACEACGIMFHTSHKYKTIRANLRKLILLVRFHCICPVGMTARWNWNYSQLLVVIVSRRPVFLAVFWLLQ